MSLRAPADASLWGTATVTATPVTKIGEGLGPAILLPSGGTRLFSFEVKEAAEVGIGVRADSEEVVGVLMGADGGVLDSGVVLMKQLSAGTYLLAVTLPAGAPPARARPALAGVEAPGTGPPEDVIRRYMEMAGINPQTAGGAR